MKEQTKFINDILELCNAQIKDLTQKLQYVLVNFVETDEGSFTFPDGDTWPAKLRSGKKETQHE